MKFKFAYGLVTCGGIGSLGHAPGTLGSLLAIPFVLLFSSNPVHLFLFLFVLSGLAVWASGVVENRLGRHDPQEIVMDEFCGMTMSLLLIPIRWETLLSGFILFRLFDIFKPPPIRALERLPKGYGIVGDDLLAGIYANLALRLLIRYAHL